MPKPKRESTIKPPPDPVPISFIHLWLAREKPAYEGRAGTLRFTLPDGHTIDVEAFVRPGSAIGLRVRGIDCWLDIEPDASNTIIVKPRAR